jgi:hypothetical protein
MLCERSIMLNLAIARRVKGAVSKVGKIRSER